LSTLGKIKKLIKETYMDIVRQDSEYSIPVYHTKLEAASLAIDVVKYALLAISYVNNTSLVWIPCLIAIIAKSIIFGRVKDKFQSTYCNPLNIIFDLFCLIIGSNAGTRSSTLGMGWMNFYFFMMTLFLVFAALIFFGVFSGSIFHILMIVMSILFFVICVSMSIFMDVDSDNGSISNSKIFAFLVIHVLVVCSIFAIYLIAFGEDGIYARYRSKKSRNNMVQIPDTARSTNRDSRDRNDVMITMGDESHRNANPSAEKKWAIPKSSSKLSGEKGLSKQHKGPDYDAEEQDWSFPLQKMG
jgi:hypothetical protein